VSPSRFSVDCVRCGHSSDDHSLDDALNLGPCDPGAKFRCTWPVKHEGAGVEFLCDCPDMVRPAEAVTP
jgi:hypothetical protein